MADEVLEGELLGADVDVERDAEARAKADTPPAKATELGAIGGAALGGLFAAVKGEDGESAAATLGRGAAGAIFGALAGATLGALFDVLAGGQKAAPAKAPAGSGGGDVAEQDPGGDGDVQ